MFLPANFGQVNGLGANASSISAVLTHSSQQLITVGSLINRSTNITSVTVGSQTATQLSTYVRQSGMTMAFFYVFAAQASAENVVVNLPVQSNQALIAHSWNNTHIQAPFFEGTLTSTAVGNNSSVVDLVSITSGNYNRVILAYAGGVNNVSSQSGTAILPVGEGALGGINSNNTSGSNVLQAFIGNNAGGSQNLSCLINFSGNTAPAIGGIFTTAILPRVVFGTPGAAATNFF